MRAMSSMVAQDDCNISYILKLPDHEDGSNVSSDSKFLMSLTSCNSARRKIVTSGYLKSMEKMKVQMLRNL
ncbi:BnaCnng04140D [Brassica napus]|uniref:BnaCnng04140D protein n=2 Tax=Brassica TaxID=3705 RepID=A0A078FPK5_BRANA|nr:BnaCnng04140D [Brassica napus]VDD08808.1 unnamed protein product [Brassica oleracea]